MQDFKFVNFVPLLLSSWPGVFCLLGFSSLLSLSSLLCCPSSPSCPSSSSKTQKKNRKRPERSLKERTVINIYLLVFCEIYFVPLLSFPVPLLTSPSCPVPLQSPPSPVPLLTPVLSLSASPHSLSLLSRLFWVFSLLFLSSLVPPIPSPPSLWPVPILLPVPLSSFLFLYFLPPVLLHRREKGNRREEERDRK